MMIASSKDLWSLAFGPPEVDPWDLAHAVERQADREPLDYRTRLLIRDSVVALKEYWGQGDFERWLARCPVREKLATICGEPFERVGFSLRERLMEKTDPEVIRQFLRDLGAR